MGDSLARLGVDPSTFRFAGFAMATTYPRRSTRLVRRSTTGRPVGDRHPHGTGLNRWANARHPYAVDVGARILVIDNYDSFVYNLVQYLGELGADPIVHRDDAITLAEVDDLDPDGILISPGPGTPDDAGLSNELIAALGGAAAGLRGVPRPAVHRSGLRRRGRARARRSSTARPRSSATATSACSRGCRTRSRPPGTTR